MINLKEFDQIFLLGLTGSGKTAIAKKLAEKLNKNYYNFDMHWDYEIKDKEAVTFLDKIEDEKDLIIDGIPYDESPGVYVDNIFEDFIKYSNKNKVCSICVFFDDIKKWIKTIISKKFYNMDTMNFYNGNYFISHWIMCYMKAVEILNKNCKNFYFYNIDKEKIFKFAQFDAVRNRILNRLNILKDANLLKVYLDLLKQEPDYDVFYQDIECINFKGYSESYKTWEKIKDFDYKDKVIFDVGCFHGYFSFKTAKLASFVYGVDISYRVLETCQILHNIYNSENVKFQQWDEYKDIPDDVNLILCLNVLHHFKEPEKFLSKIKKDVEIIFEIDNTQKKMIEKYIKIENIIESHRENRIILMGKRI